MQAEQHFLDFMFIDDVQQQLAVFIQEARSWSPEEWDEYEMGHDVMEGKKKEKYEN